jgi:hypothetical protein
VGRVPSAEIHPGGAAVEANERRQQPTLGEPDACARLVDLRQEGLIAEHAFETTEATLAGL